MQTLLVGSVVSTASLQNVRNILLFDDIYHQACFCVEKHRRTADTRLPLQPAGTETAGRCPPLAPIGPHWPPLAPAGPHWPPLPPLAATTDKPAFGSVSTFVVNLRMLAEFRALETVGGKLLTNHFNSPSLAQR